MISPFDVKKMVPPKSHLTKSQQKYQDTYYKKLQKYSKVYIGVQREEKYLRQSYGRRKSGRIYFTSY